MNNRGIYWILGIKLFCLLILFFPAIFVGCDKADTITSPNTVSWVADFQELDKLCWQFSVSKSTDWTVRCTYDTGIGLSPNKVVMVEDPDLSKALQIRTIAGVDSVIIDEIE